MLYKWGLNDPVCSWGSCTGSHYGAFLHPLVPADVQADPCLAASPAPLMPWTCWETLLRNTPQILINLVWACDPHTTSLLSFLALINISSCFLFLFPFLDNDQRGQKGFSRQVKSSVTPSQPSLSLGLCNDKQDLVLPRILGSKSADAAQEEIRPKSLRALLRYQGKRAKKAMCRSADLQRTKEHHIHVWKCIWKAIFLIWKLFF